MIAAVVARESRQLRVRPGRIGIRDPRTRWGSCSARGNLSFSWRLVIAPAEVLEYVVVHELCHLRELNHSKRFYRLLDEARPGLALRVGVATRVRSRAAGRQRVGPSMTVCCVAAQSFPPA